jgi:predicted ATPase
MLSRLLIKGFKSIRELDLQLTNLNVLMGANGAGKSNLLDFFRMVRALIEGRLPWYVARQGGIEAILHYGHQETTSLASDIHFDSGSYFLDLGMTEDNQHFLVQDGVRFQEDNSFCFKKIEKESGSTEEVACKTLDCDYHKTQAQQLMATIKAWTIYHFYDTSESSPIKSLQTLEDNQRLHHDGSNLAAFLYRLKHIFPSHYQSIRNRIRQVAPFFGDFQLNPFPEEPLKIQLQWNEQGSNYPFVAQELSDSTLRFMCLATLLLQPQMPTMLLIDEPELGQDPFAIAVLGALCRLAAQRCQLILSTQSLALVDEFEVENVIVVERQNGQSGFRRVAEEEFKEWIEEYKLGES